MAAPSHYVDVPFDQLGADPGLQLVRVDGWLANYGQLGQNLLFASHSMSSRHVPLEASLLTRQTREQFARDCLRLCKVEIEGRLVRPPGPRSVPYVEAHTLTVLR
jgi:hypothetical protein